MIEIYSLIIKLAVAIFLEMFLIEIGQERVFHDYKELKSKGNKRKVDNIL
jgi:hypothetical protein